MKHYLIANDGQEDTAIYIGRGPRQVRDGLSLSLRLFSENGQEQMSIVMSLMHPKSLKDSSSRNPSRLRQRDFYHILTNDGAAPATILNVEDLDIATISDSKVVDRLSI